MRRLSSRPVVPEHPRQDPLDNPLERLELLAGDDNAIASFLDEIDVRSPRERELLGELARPGPVARPERLAADHRKAVVALRASGGTASTAHVRAAASGRSAASSAG